MSSLELDLISFSDADFSFTASQPFANGLATVGANALRMQVRSTTDDPTVWAELSTANGLLVVTGGGVTITGQIPQQTLLKMPAAIYFHSCVMISQSGLGRSEVFRGTLTHNHGPTQFQAGSKN